jgi:hypothetical protein
VYRWRWGPDASVETRNDTDEHVSPLAEDLDEHAPWLVRRFSEDGPRGYHDRDLIGVLWGALRASRQRITDLETRVSELAERVNKLVA